MKNINLKKISLFSLLTLALAAPAIAGELPGLDKSPADISAFPQKGSEKWVKVVYSRPQANGRKVFGDLVDFGKVWRTGANEATEVTFFEDAKIMGKTLKKGTYTMFTIPTKKNWTVIFNSDLNQWGAYTYNKKNDVLRVKVPAQKRGDKVEAFTIAFEDQKNKKVNMVLAWENTQVNIPFQK